jgi:hypothetical protein
MEKEDKSLDDFDKGFNNLFDSKMKTIKEN